MLTTPSELSAKTGSPGPVPREVWLNRHPQTPRRCLADPHQLPTEHPESFLTPTVTSWCQDKPDKSHVTHFLSLPTWGVTRAARTNRTWNTLCCPGGWVG